MTGNGFGPITSGNGGGIFNSYLGGSEGPTKFEVKAATTKVDGPLLKDVNQPLTANQVLHIFKTESRFNDVKDLEFAEGQLITVS